MTFAIPDTLIDRILTVLWANWEDPLTQTVKEIQGAFGHLLELNGKSPDFLARVASQLIERGAHSKGRYVPLAALVPKMGARKLLELRPNLLEESLDAMRDDSVCCAAGTLIKELSAALLCEMESEERESANLGIKPGTPSQTPSERWVIGNGKGKKGDTDKGRGRGRDEVCIREGGGVALNKWREWWIPVTLSALLRPGRERAGCAQYALPHLMRQDAASIVFLLEGLKKEVDEEADEADEGQTKEADKSQTTKEAAGDPTAMDPMATFKIPGVTTTKTTTVRIPATVRMTVVTVRMTSEGPRRWSRCSNAREPRVFSTRTRESPSCASPSQSPPGSKCHPARPNTPWTSVCSRLPPCAGTEGRAKKRSSFYASTVSDLAFPVRSSCGCFDALCHARCEGNPPRFATRSAP